MVYCPSCVSFGEECNPDPEDFDAPCSYYRQRKADPEYYPEDDEEE